MTKVDWGVRRTASGKFRHECHIVRIPSTLDSTGQKTSAPVICWPHVPCRVETLSGRQAEVARALYAQAEFRVTTDFIEGVNERHRLLLIPSDRQLHIGYVQDTDLEGVELVFLCSEVR